jgi:hypothetical protein
MGEETPWHAPCVIPAKAGIHVSQKYRSSIDIPWVPAFAGTTPRFVYQPRMSFNCRI